MAKEVAWMIDRKGKMISVVFHPYCMEDDDLSSEAEVASFLIKNEANDLDLAKKVIRQWIALGIVDEVESDDDIIPCVEEFLVDWISGKDSIFQQKLEEADYIKLVKNSTNFDSVDSIKAYCKKIIANLEYIQLDIKQSINQQFIRVRVGGMYNSIKVDIHEIYFRISSVGFNWSDIIHKTLDKLRDIYFLNTITICRDKESDGASSEKFYKSKKGVLYKECPVDEFLSGDLESNPIFDSKTSNYSMIGDIMEQLGEGKTLLMCSKSKSFDKAKLWQYLYNKEKVY